MKKRQELNYRIIIATRLSLLYAIGVFLGCAVLVFALLIPQTQEILDLNSKLQKEEPRTKQLREKLAALENLVTTAEFQQVATVDEALPGKKPLLELLMSLSTVAQQTGATVTQFKLSPGLVASDSAALAAQLQAQSDKGYGQLQTELEITGSFAQIQDFLLQIERISPFSTVVNMEINGEVNSLTQATDGTKPFTASLKTDTYFFTQAVSVRVESPLPVVGPAQQNVLQALASFVPTELPEQTEVLGGGLEDLFGVKKFGSEAELETALQPLTAPQATPSLLTQ